MWVYFEPQGDKLLVTIKTRADSITGRLGKGWDARNRRADRG